MKYYIHNRPSELSIISEREGNGQFIVLEGNYEDNSMDLDNLRPNQPESIIVNPLQEYAGYMPLRDEYETLYENDMEMYL
mmetsp:Transcript_3905/g.523  ORF Transcript_3905/g.523 Transcript_3905/m.523 type:complete len:80 (+) Transcript_3905:67-306(+)